MTRPAPLDRLSVARAVEAALAEDLGRAGDVTSAATIPADAQARVAIVARTPGRLAGLQLAEAAFASIEPAIRFVAERSDGDRLEPGSVVARIEGPARAVLTGERTALNFLGHLSGVATLTAVFADKIAHTGAKICDTRKTTPGLRVFEKYAVRCGGGQNHRFGLDDAILIKDNHIAVAGGVEAALRAAKAQIGHLVKIEIEVDTLDQLDRVISEGADAVLLDNMDPATLREAVRRVAGRMTTEASGTVSLETVAAIAEAGVDLISVGRITHSAPTLDLGLDVALV
ncbi:carboxylating nicotinate-nucleotide diphosphorylase [Chenggangzhangella methanolivorans]|uniref:Probable nicotinate-nucleotide pyrophosphorylase [carboxylating] n=1 Tax=Chenggangzhangella methanolivorans TaxID=1437009 RepID=A0A9E6UN72_9HYPH|nr:carboxylating nicotinate-nucleotide diphosphorylase [Chenggangzhangella methanolivorans]QZN99883.1 carboxylating nicotinate-nucleotide diphosphorylase [Chenggangzhangella methanolivorans]